MIHENVVSYDKTKDSTIDICLNCTKKTCKGDCKLKKNKTKKQTNDKHKTNKL